MTLPQLPGMQVMHALVGCQKRWINSLRRRFHSVDMMHFPSVPLQRPTLLLSTVGAVSMLLTSFPGSSPTRNAVTLTSLECYTAARLPPFWFGPEFGVRVDPCAHIDRALPHRVILRTAIYG
jgi:hypothetical protein